ncbi:hypothetical protein DPMN_044810 [Dreissena polymorpha]|uniref:Uncharacterized protein n=1 Tax=Dreissena polymorpha TaxID=45954 RepID=A0A9D4D3M0_DREPO|nr:hypothetical protein DPMN_044810 [Dreissena polymorpha]
MKDLMLVLVLHVFLNHYSTFAEMTHFTPSSSEWSLLCRQKYFGLSFQSVEDIAEHNSARMADDADDAVILAQLEVAIFRYWNDQRLGQIIEQLLLVQDILE